MTEISEETIAHHIIGRLIIEEKYTFTDKNLIATVVRDTLEERPFAILDLTEVPA